MTSHPRCDGRFQRYGMAQTHAAQRAGLTGAYLLDERRCFPALVFEARTAGEGANVAGDRLAANAG